MQFLKRTVPLGMTFLLGVVFFLQPFSPHPASGLTLKHFSNWVAIVASVSLVLGLGSLFLVHTGKIRKQGVGWGYSAVLLVCFFWISIAGFWPMRVPDPQQEGQTIWKIGGDGIIESHYFWVYWNVYRPCGATMFSILGFFIASAAFRAFRARSLEASLLLVSAVLIMGFNTPWGYIFGKWLAAHASNVFWLPDFVKEENLGPNIRDWILTVPNMAAKRAILFGVVLGGLATSLRIIFGIERSYLGGGRD